MIGDDEKGWSLTMGEHEFTMDTREDRDRTLALVRILGYISTNDSVANVCMGHPLDALILDDIELITGIRPAIAYAGETYNIRLPVKWAISQEAGIW